MEGKSNLKSSVLQCVSIAKVYVRSNLNYPSLFSQDNHNFDKEGKALKYSNITFSFWITEKYPDGLSGGGGLSLI
jgi:hypothetical protein